MDADDPRTITIDHKTLKLEDLKKYEHVLEAKIYNNDIKKEDGTNADPADIFKIFKNVISFVFRHESNMYKKETAANLIKEPHFAKLQRLILHNVTPEFDFNAFLNGVSKIHPNINCDIFFKCDAFTHDEIKALKEKIRRIPPTMFPNCDFGCLL